MQLCNGRCRVLESESRPGHRSPGQSWSSDQARPRGPRAPGSGLKCACWRNLAGVKRHSLLDRPRAVGEFQDQRDARRRPLASIRVCAAPAPNRRRGGSPPQRGSRRPPARRGAADRLSVHVDSIDEVWSKAGRCRRFLATTSRGGLEARGPEVVSSCERRRPIPRTINRQPQLIRIASAAGAATVLTLASVGCVRIAASAAGTRARGELTNRVDDRRRTPRRPDPRWRS